MPCRAILQRGKAPFEQRFLVGTVMGMLHMSLGVALLLAGAFVPTYPVPRTTVVAYTLTGGLLFAVAGSTLGVLRSGELPRGVLVANPDKRKYRILNWRRYFAVQRVNPIREESAACRRLTSRSADTANSRYSWRPSQAKDDARR